MKSLIRLLFRHLFIKNTFSKDFFTLCISKLYHRVQSSFHYAKYRQSIQTRFPQITFIFLQSIYQKTVRDFILKYFVYSQFDWVCCQECFMTNRNLNFGLLPEMTKIMLKTLRNLIDLNFHFALPFQKKAC